MSFFSRLLGNRPSPRPNSRQTLVPLWHRVIALSRTPAFYAQDRVADTVEGRFDMVTTVLAVTLLRMEASPALRPACALITELFVEDMDGQLRESGVGDVVMGKHMGKLMAALGGRLGALRSAFAADDAVAEVAEALTRNVHWVDDAGEPHMLATRLIAFRAALAALPDEAVAAGDFTL